MRTQSFQQMQEQYASPTSPFDADDLEEREKLLSKYPHTVIVEGTHLEFDNLTNWIQQNISRDSLENIYYGKISYDYGFAEYFMNDKESEQKLRAAIPDICFAPDPRAPSRLLRTDGADTWIPVDGTDNPAITIVAD